MSNTRVTSGSFVRCDNIFASSADGCTSQMLTTSIFAISTLISSHQIYNLLGQVQEDNLQQLALFSAYGKCVQQQQRDLDVGAGGETEVGSSAAASSTPAAQTETKPQPPFQRIELLVRDSPRIISMMPKAGSDGKWPDASDASAWAPVDAECTRMLDLILSRSANADVTSVREQIRDCFKEVTLAMLPNPGCVARKCSAVSGCRGRCPILHPFCLLCAPQHGGR